MTIFKKTWIVFSQGWGGLTDYDPLAPPVKVKTEKIKGPRGQIRGTVDFLLHVVQEENRKPIRRKVLIASMITRGWDKQQTSQLLGATIYTKGKYVLAYDAHGGNYWSLAQGINNVGKTNVVQLGMFLTQRIMSEVDYFVEYNNQIID